ncbi:MAG TPA: hypothetical protein VGR73_12760 [Bryobacteraceae bacterium]|nr:hypothetical protein [Bryobacteraceae bacterium]
MNCRLDIIGHYADFWPRPVQNGLRPQSVAKTEFGQEAERGRGRPPYERQVGRIA